jgi:hypothetical protein
MLKFKLYPEAEGGFTLEAKEEGREILQHIPPSIGHARLRNKLKVLGFLQADVKRLMDGEMVARVAYA